MRNQYQNAFGERNGNLLYDGVNLGLGVAGTLSKVPKYSVDRTGVPPLICSGSQDFKSALSVYGLRITGTEIVPSAINIRDIYNNN